MTAVGPLAGGLADPVYDSQATFRAILDAMSRPGTIRTIAPPVAADGPLAPAAAASCLTLLDSDTRLWLTPSALRSRLAAWLVFHTGVATTNDPQRAAFALVTQGAAMPALDAFDWGTDEEPERSTTLIVEVSSLDDRSGWTLRGPGIESSARLRVDGLPATFLPARQRMSASFPRGVDLLLTCGTRLAALPRTTRLEA